MNTTTEMQETAPEAPEVRGIFPSCAFDASLEELVRKAESRPVDRPAFLRRVDVEPDRQSALRLFLFD
jgi:hypothetical protein